ncbi:MAG: hypothetical protein Q4D30_10290 [Bacteroidales bacterium]|nr:hypothetical protein [Bacteroidales bacterium]
MTDFRHYFIVLVAGLLTMSTFIPGATHCDLYDGGEDHYIPFDKLEAFFRGNLK